MTGSPEDIPNQNEPPSDERAKTEERKFKEITLGKLPKAKVLKRVWSLLWFNYGMVFLVVFLDGFDEIKFELEPWVLVSLIGAVMSSSAVYVIKRSVDYTYSD